jgi:hypothetical protein
MFWFVRQHNGLARSAFKVGTLSAMAACFVLSGCSEDPPAKTTASDARREIQARRSAAMAALQEVKAPVAQTDKGRHIRLFRMPEQALPTPMLDTMEGEMAHEWGLSMRVIRTKPPDRAADCHGWIFADGRYWMVGADVETILQDNDYQTVTDPAPGDLVIYRSASNPITHSGLVYSVNGSKVMVESKWAWLGCYLHSAESQPYGGRPVYYRSPRPRHNLKLQ